MQTHTPSKMTRFFQALLCVFALALLPVTASAQDDPADPAADGADPAADGTDPAADGTDPAADGTEPADDGTEPADETSSGSYSHLSGDYSSEWGDVSITINGTEFKGTFAGGGEMVGTIEGTEIFYSWTQPDSPGGKGYFSIQKDGKLVGSWGYGESMNNGGEWTCYR